MPEKISVKEILEEFRKKKILIVGDVMVDEYLWGKVTRISPEAPVPVVSCTGREHRMGGAANVAINIKSLGAEPILCSVTGNDAGADVFHSVMQAHGISPVGIVRSPELKTTIKTRVIASHQQLIRIDHEDTAFIPGKVEDALLEQIKLIISGKSVDAVIFQDYDKGVLTPRIIGETINEARQHMIPTLVDPKRRSFKAYRGVSLFKPNLKELNDGLNLSLSKNDGDGIARAGKLLMDEMELGSIMVTLSEKGIFVHNGNQWSVLPAEARDITDVSGAGDTVISVAGLSLSCGLDLFATATLANMAGGLVCEKVGVVPITAGMLLHENIVL